jgi:hypothetical protein
MDTGKRAIQTAWIMQSELFPSLYCEVMVKDISVNLL